VSEGLETLVYLHAVIQTRGHAVNGEVWRVHEARGGPLAVTGL
jgi:hypothetical protein